MSKPIRLLARLVAVAAAAALAACSSAAPSETGSGPPGGRLRVGAVSAGGAPVADPHGKLFSEADWARLSAIYDTVTVLGDDGKAAPGLAESWSSNDDATQWTFTLRDATFSDGSKVTAADALYSIGRLQEKAAENGGRIGAVDMSRSKAVDDSTLLLVTPKPDADLPRALTLGSFVVKDGTSDFAKPVGSGAFVLDRLDEQVAQLSANPAWRGGQPGVGTLEIRGFTDPQAMAQAVTGGAIDMATGVQPAAAKAAGNGVQVSARPGAEAVPLLLRVDTAPFDDARVREAVKLALDRPALVEQVYLGYGTVGRDMIRLKEPGVPSDVPEVTRDVERAKKLLAEAGHSNGLAVELHTTNAYPAMPLLATAAKTQLAEAGIDVTITQHPADRYWSTAYGVKPFTVGYYGSSATFGTLLRATVLSTASYSETRWRDAAFDAAYAKAMATTDDASRAAQLGELHKRMAADGGWVVWGFGDRLTLHRDNVKGVSTTGSLYDLTRITVG